MMTTSLSKHTNIDLGTKLQIYLILCEVTDNLYEIKLRNSSAYLSMYGEH